MTTIRIKHQKNYTCIANGALRDTSLSFKARGILSFLLSFPDDWEVHTSHIVDGSDPDGITSVQSGLKELKVHGYLRKVPVRDERGRILQWETQPTENPEPREPTVRETQNMGFPHSGKPGDILSNVSNEVTKERSTEHTKSACENSKPAAQNPVPPPEPQKIIPPPAPTAPPTPVEVIPANPYDSQFLYGNERRRDYREAMGKRNAINPERFETVEHQNDFWQQSVARLMATDKNMESGVAERIATGYCRQINAGDNSNPQAWSYYRLWQQGQMASIPVANTGKEIELSAAFADFLED